MNGRRRAHVALALGNEPLEPNEYGVMQAPERFGRFGEGMYLLPLP